MRVHIFTYCIVNMKVNGGEKRNELVVQLVENPLELQKTAF